MTTCPRCGSTDVETTTKGGLGPPEHDPNRATCCACGHSGNAGDWNMLRAERERWRKLREWLADDAEQWGHRIVLARMGELEARDPPRDPR